MTSEQTSRRRRGRAIRRRRRLERESGQEALYFRMAWDRIREIARPAIEFLMVATARGTPLLFTPRDGAGPRRQLLEHGRAPRKGGR